MNQKPKLIYFYCTFTLQAQKVGCNHSVTGNQRSMINTQNVIAAKNGFGSNQEL